MIGGELCKNWEKHGKNEFARLYKALGREADDGVGRSDQKRCYYELCLHVITGKLRIEQAVATLAEAAELYPSTPSLLVDIFSVLDVETFCSEDKQQRERFLSLVQATTAFIAEMVLKERLDQDTLEGLGLINSKEQFQAKYVKTKTKIYYRQQKFNLLREENEGYAKLVTELNQDLSDETTSEVLNNIKSLIGCFDLDPNRVLDILLESFECHPEFPDFFIPVIKAFNSDADRLCHMLGFKFHFYQQTQDSQTPKSLYRVAALLLHSGLIQLNQLYPHLAPSDNEILDKHKQDVQDAKQYARKLTVAVLSDKPEEKDKDEKEAKPDQNENNQKLGLCEELLAIGSWSQAQQIMDRLPRYFATAHDPLAHALCALVSATIQPLYAVENELPSAICQAQKKKAEVKTLHPQVHTFPELQATVFPMISYLGAHLSCQPVLLVKLVRLGQAFMNKNKSQDNLPPDLDAVFRGFLTMLDEAVLPSLSLLPANCCISEEIWGLISNFKYHLRYRLYGQWKNESYALHPKVIRARADCIDKAKYIMKRLSKENVKQLGRHLGKLSHSNPGILFEYILSQIQKYDNFIGPVVDSLKYLTSMSYDVLAYCIIEALANPERERLKHDDTNLSLWLQSLASFSSAIFKKYNIELTGLIEYVLNQLKAGKSYDLLILREVIQKMAGIEVSEELTDDQLHAMAGGDLLKQEGGYFSQVRNTRKSSNRLRDILLENNLAVPLCLLMAQQRDGIVFNGSGTPGSEDARHIKLIGKLYDQCQDTLFQFGSFLSTQLSAEDLSKRLPRVEELVTTYHLPVEAAFFLTRMQYSHSIQAKYEELVKPHKKDKATMTYSFKAQKYMEAAELIMNPVAEQIRMLHMPRIWENMSPRFFLTFWSLSLYDLWTPVEAYEKQVAAVKTQLAALEDNKDMNPSKRRKEKERCSSLIDKLKEEQKKQEEHVKNIMKRLEAEKDSWVFSGKTNKTACITDLLQVCVFPRCCFTAMDAVYCAKFIHKLHELKTPNFSSLICYDRLFSDNTCTVTSFTENEAHRYGRFLCESLSVIMRWHSDKAIYEKECMCIGFKSVYRQGSAPANSKAQADQLDYENYRHICQKWQYRLAKASISCLESGSYVQIRNALIVLLKILPHFPKVTNFGQAIERRVDRICQEEKDKRPDIYALAVGYAGQLKAKKKTWVPEHMFHHREQKAAGAAKAAAQPKVTVKEEVNEVSSSTETAAGKKADTGDSAKKAESKEVKSDSQNNKSGSSSTTESKKDINKSPSKEKEKKEKKEVKVEKTKEKASKEAKEGREVKVKDGERKIKVEKDASKDKDKTSQERKEEKAKAKQVKAKEKQRLDKEKKDKRESKGHEEKIKVKEEKKDRSRGPSHERDKPDERSSSVASSSSHESRSVRRSAEPSPKPSDERESKRRRVENTPSGSGSKEYDRKENFMKSPTYSEKSRDRESDKKLDRKRTGDHSEDREEAKRYKSEEARHKQNGDQDGHWERSKDRHRDHSRDHEHRKEKSHEREVMVTETKKSKDGNEKVKKKDKTKSKK